MVRRNLRSDFVGGAYVFPGGAVDPLDGGPEAEALLRRADRRRGQRAAGLRVGRPGLLGGRGPRDLRGGGPPAGPARRAAPTSWPATPRRRRASPPSGPRSTQGTRRFLDLCRDEGLRLSVGDIHYFAHWITPRGAPRRYDTRFFVAAAPPGQIAAHDAGETIAEVWISPARRAGPAPRRRDRDHLPDHPQPPGHRTLRHQRRAARRRPRRRRAPSRPSSHGSCPTATACASCCRATPATSAAPVPDPGDGSARGDFNEAVRAVSMRANEEGPDAAPGPRPAGAQPRRAVIPAVPDFGIGPAPEPGRVDEVAPGVLRLTAPNPGLMTGPGTNTYLVGRRRAGRHRPRPGRRVPHGGHRGGGRPAGPGPHHPRHPHPRRPRPGRGRAGRGHRGPGRGLRPRRGLRARRARRGGVDRCPVPATPAHGRLTLRALHTPGHASDHLCWLVEEQRSCSPATTSCTARPW